MGLTVPAPSEVFEVDLDDGAKIRVRRHGNPDGPRLTVTHGNGFAADAYLPFWQLLAPRYDLLVFDFRNHGQNVPVTPANHSYAQLARDLDRVLDAIDAWLGRKPTAGIFHSMSGRAAMKHALEIGFPWAALILFDPPNVPPPGHPHYEAMDLFERRLAEWAMRRPDHFADPAELARQYAETRAHSNWVAGAHELMARAVLRPSSGEGWQLACPRELEASIYLQAMTLHLWPPVDAYGGPVKLIAADPEARGAPAPAFANRALAEELGYVYEAISGTGHLLQIQKPEECRVAMLRFLDEIGVG